MKTIKYILGVCLMISTSSIFAQGLQGIVVEKYYSTDAADAAEAAANGAVVPLTAGSTVYRVYVDMAAGYEFSQIYGSPTHNLTVTSSANFFNDPTFGVPYAPTVSAANFRTETAWLDSYFAAGAVRNGSVGVLKSEDTDGSVGHATGLLANNAGACFGLPITGAGAQDGMVPSSPSTFVTPNSLGFDGAVGALDQTAGSSVVISNGFLASLGGIVGATSSNMVLIGQFTTSGSLSFEFNVQLINTSTGIAENYVASNPVGGELTHPTLTYNSGIAPVVAITAPANGANVNLGSNVTITATATDAGGTITSVEFFVDAVSIGVDATSPYSVSYNAAALGSRVITAVAIDNDCNETTSASRTINVVNAPTSAPANDGYANSSVRVASGFPACANIFGSLANATNSSEALSSEPVGAGQDVWYSFVAATNGARIQATTTVNDLVLELQTSAGVLVETENANGVGGTEVMVVGGLTPGATYFLAVRNFNTVAAGSFALCIQSLVASDPDNGTTFSNLCNAFKCDWNGAQLFSATFDDGTNQYTASSPSTSIPFSAFGGLQYNTVYQVTITTTFIQNDGTGANPTTVVVVSPAYTITIAQHPLTSLRSIDRCPTTRPVSAFISTDRFVCGATSYDWEFVEVNPLNPAEVISLEPVIINSGSSARFIRINQLPTAEPGDRYRVRVRPVFASGPGTFTTGYEELCVAGAASMEVEEGTAIVRERSLIETISEEMAVYPNPNRGEVFTVQAAGIESEQVFVRILDMMGKEVYSTGYSVDGVLNAMIQMDRALSAGVYMIELIDGENRMVERMIVE
jgi:hypothetical protein